MKCGFSKVCITPKIGTVMGGTFELKHAEGILDELYARAVSFDDGERKSIIVSLDLCLMGTDVNDECRARISRECNVDIDAIILTCTHTHSGPLVWGYENLENGTYSQDDVKLLLEYRAFLIDKICAAARLSVDSLLPAKFYTATDKAEGIAHIRTFRMQDGRVVTNPGMDWNCSGDPITCCPIPDNTGVDHPLFAPNETVKILKIERDGGEDVCLVNFALHATCTHLRKISADFPGFLCSIVEHAIDNVNCVFIQSAQGDVAQINRNPSEAEKRFLTEDNRSHGETRNKARQVGQVLAASVLKNYMTAEEIATDKISFAKKELAIPANKDDGNYDEALKITRMHEEGRHHELPYDGMDLVTFVANAERIVRMKSAPDFFKYSFFAMTIGDFAFLGIPGEVFTEIGNMIREASPYEHLMLCGISNV
ncbi:MAG: hypothetical protein E7678_08155, partial [Ruminococcaceae bacterium]|nr:hypothetical protein [Oscillospiraceae bacterium]